jgi:SARP family transcriptional regulator, regulator of embCAB operon
LADEQRIRVHICGRLRVEVDGSHVEGALGGRQGQLLFAYLVLNRFREIPRAEAAGALWPSAATADRALTTYLSKIRRALGGRIEGRSEIRLALPTDAWIDIEAADEALHRGEGALASGDWGRAYSAVHVALYIAERGFLAGCDLPWAVEARRRIEDIHTRALECSAGACLAAGGAELPGAEKNARRAVELAPFRESAHRILMEVLAARGNEAEALRVYAEIRDRLRDELGTAPGSALESIAATLQRGHEPTFVGGSEMRTFMFTDIERSTDLLGLIGDDAWQDLLAWHDQTLRTLFAEHSGEEVDHTGDGFFAAFPDAERAVSCAIAIQRRLHEHRREHGFAPQVRIGLHATEAVRRGDDYIGQGVHEAARIGAAAEGGEIVASTETVAGAQDGVLSEPRAVELKGISRPVEIVTVGWR